jgi:hypothetical protein
LGNGSALWPDGRKRCIQSLPGLGVGLPGFFLFTVHSESFGVDLQGVNITTTSGF